LIVLFVVSMLNLFIVYIIIINKLLLIFYTITVINLSCKNILYNNEYFIMELFVYFMIIIFN